MYTILIYTFIFHCTDKFVVHLSFFAIIHYILPTYCEHLAQRRKAQWTMKFCALVCASFSLHFASNKSNEKMAGQRMRERRARR